MMNWDAVAATAEIIGSIAVVATLIYLSVQIRQSTRESHANSVHLLNAQFTAITERLSADGEFAEIWLRGSDGLLALSPAEKIRYEAGLTQMFVSCATQYYLFRNGHVPAEIFEYVEAQLRETLRRPAVRHWWKENEDMHDRLYREYVNQLIEAA